MTVPLLEHCALLLGNLDQNGPLETQFVAVVLNGFKPLLNKVEYFVGAGGVPVTRESIPVALAVMLESLRGFA